MKYPCSAGGTDSLAAELEMARERLRRVGEFALTLPEEQRDDLRVILGPEFDPGQEAPTSETRRRET